MENNKSNNRVPKLRFPGFIGDWEEKKFKDFTTATGKKNRDNLPYERYSISNENGFYPQNEQFEGGAGHLRDIDCSKHIIVKPKSFAYNPARINIGSIGYQNLDKEVIVSPLYEVFKTTDACDDIFLWHWFHSDIFHRIVLNEQQGGVRLCFSYKKLRDCAILLPKIAEQRKITECLTEMDETISAQTEKVESLKAHKKGLMQQLFPQPGETSPKLRFLGFEGEWKEKKLGEFITEVKETTTDTVNNPIYSLTIEDGLTAKTERYERSFLVTKKDNVFKVVSQNDFVSNPMNLRFGAIGFNKNNFNVCVSGYYDVFRFNKCGVTSFWSNYLKSDLILHIYDIIAIGSLLEKRRVYFSILQNLKLLVPSFPEQQKIASCLSELDKNIEAESAKLEALKNHKKGLMQQLFPESIK